MKDSFLLLEICLPGFPVLRFEVMLLVDLWWLKVLLCSFLLIAIAAAHFVWRCTQLGLQKKFAVFLCVIICWNDHLFIATEGINALKIFQSKMVNTVPIQNYSVNNATAWQGSPTVQWTLGILQKIELILGNLIRILELTLAFMHKCILPRRKD